MARLRLVFVALALLLLVPLALLVKKALASVELERELRHRAVAERVVDEMERELTAWLRREEDRPYEEYRYFVVPANALAQSVDLALSPLATPPAEPFILGYFQIDPDGATSSPLVPRNEQAARLAAGWQPTPEVQATVARVESTVAAIWHRPPPRPKDGKRQLAGTTVPLGRQKARAGRAELKAERRAAEDGAERGALSVLEKLNRGGEERQQRPTKVESSLAQNVYNFARDQDNFLQQSAPQRAGATDELAREVEQTLQTPLDSTVTVRLEPMVARRAPGGELVLYRTVQIGRRAYRQGVVVDPAALVTWLGARVLSAADLGAQVRIAPADAAPPPPTTTLEAYAYRHRFAEPFAALAAVISLAPLPETRGTVYLLTLALLLGVAATAGLFAVYRMVAVRVAYAERRSSFVSAVTHELKTPLTAIRMYGEMLRDGVVASEEKRQQYYETLTAESERLTRLVDNVLELSRLEKKTRTMRMEVGDVAPVAAEVVATLSPHAERLGFRLRLTAEPDLPPVRHDRDALVQVLFNLIDNALKYARAAADKEIVLSARRVGDGVALTVADRGPGVAGRHLKKIFQPFYRGENELTRTAQGTGIGLALVHGLVERMGGSVSGRNRDGGGFEVRVVLAAPG